MTFNHRYIHVIKLLFSGCLIIFWCLHILLAWAQVVHECDSWVLWPDFAKSLVETIVPDDQRKFFTENNLEKARKSFDTYCCKSWLLWESDCAEKELYNDDQLVVSSPYLIEHLLRVVRTYVNGNNEECDRYDLDCRTFLDEEANYPWKWVCWKNWTEPNIWDPLCSKYGIEKWVNQLIAGTDPVMPWEIVWIFKEFWITGKGSEILVVPKLNERDPVKYTLPHILRRTCDEVIAIMKSRNLTNERQLGITYLSNDTTYIGLSELELCNAHMKELFNKNANYAIIWSQQRGVHALEYDRFVLMWRMEDLMNDMLDVVSKYANSRQEVWWSVWDKAAVQCSI